MSIAQLYGNTAVWQAAQLYGSTALWQHSCMATQLSKESKMVAKTKFLIVATELRSVRMTNLLSAQHIQRKIRGSDSGVVEDPFPVGIFSVTDVNSHRRFGRSYCLHLLGPRTISS
jgi:hypothetical protein